MQEKELLKPPPRVHKNLASPHKKYSYAQIRQKQPEDTHEDVLKTCFNRFKILQV